MGKRFTPIIRHLLLLLIGVVCLLQKDVDNGICNALCKKNFDGGQSQRGSCICFVRVGKIDDFAHGRINIPVNDIIMHEEPRQIVIQSE